jgi:hypothetical protein
MSDLEQRIIDLAAEKGPCTGLEIRKAIEDAESLDIWKTCRTSPKLAVQGLGRRYLRLDRNVEGYARLSPSILREFFTYSVIGLLTDPTSVLQKREEVQSRIREISRYKMGLARDMVSDVIGELQAKMAVPRDDLCFIIAGDIVYDMAHDVPRPERSTGRLVRGSDIDLVVVVSDSTPDDVVRSLDQLIYQRKYRMLINPIVNEEVDYKIKRLGVVREQARFDTFSNMVACKILQEGMLLYGSETLFLQVNTIIEQSQAPRKLEELESIATGFRQKAEHSILYDDLDETDVEGMHIFYSAEEFEEFE